ncbi:pre-rRNA processing protein-like protein Utp22 [Xylona heveae TC161]|uniref:U3 small nucleolar RNA-associated protein 22 n=1 Tax=Xylona heveae (strain CBS 132557 / TC161) TaxID=1328760 RepID=A0A164ZAZ6_XYLHT|nr:pre-rRNA processing protein-like protein Utp22 [Xylona heveae TC161]KZF18883.1 pre-rRNA processing protein-like protein Utp22 [Xylona heveae TC161]
MASHIPKRRKLDHASSSENETDEESFVDAAKQIPIKTESMQPSSQKHAPQNKNREPTDPAPAFSAEVYKSNLFKLQTDELLAEVRPNFAERLVAVDNALRKIKGIIEEIPDSGPITFSEATTKFQKLDKIQVPFPEPKPQSDPNYKLEYSRPSAINVVGSYVLKTMAKSNSIFTVDVAVVMPSEIFQEKDYLNYRYFHKRAFYLACLAKGLNEAKDCRFSLKFDLLHGNLLQPVLIVESFDGSGDYDFSKSNARIQIIPTIPETTFNKSKTMPEKNSVRPNRDAAQSKASLMEPTPYYNATIRADCSLLSYNKFLHTASAFAESYRDCCILGKIWLRQRGFGGGVHDGGFGSFEWAALSAMLLFGGGPRGRNVLSPGYSSYQLFKAVLQFLATRDLILHPLAFESDLQATKSDSPVIFDGSRGLNILFKMTPSSYQRLRFESQLSIQMLNDSLFDHFESTFILRSNEALQAFDVVARIPITCLPAGTTNLPKEMSSEVQILAARIFNVLRQGLGNRARLVSVSPPALAPWALKSKKPNFSGRLEFEIGLLLDPSNANRTVDQGPPAEEKQEAASFRKFWGPKAELRRFRDGRIIETVIWSTAETGTSVIQQIISWILSRHFGDEVAAQTTLFGDDFKKLYTKFGMGNLDILHSFQSIESAFATLERDVRGIEDLPLHVRQLSGSDAQLRYTSITLPSAESLHLQDRPADVVLQFEGSGRWPDDLVAMQQTKIAFLLKIGESLQALGRGIVVRPGLENELYSKMNSAFLDIFYPNHFKFRLRIHNDREQALLEKQVVDRSLDPRSRDEAVKALSAYKRMFVHSPLHTQTFKSLCTRFPLLGPTIRLVKRWFDAHLLSNHFYPELIELIVARIFLRSYPWQPPSSLTTGFLRTLAFIARWDWRSEPLVVDLSTESTEMTAQDIEAISARFSTWRKLDPAMHRVALFAASNLDLEGIAWSESRPSKVAATRLTALARSACLAVKNAGMHLDPATVFSTSLADYDFVVRLNQRLLKNFRTNKKSSSDFKNIRVQSAENLDLVDCDPVRSFLNELEDCYSNNIVFFNDSNTSSFIAGLWSPSTAPRPWKVGMTYSSQPSCEKDETQIQVNKSGILHEIGRLGGELILDIEARRC